ncbi:DUF2924 domain-containing protein [Bremerella sp. T1]|uniref:DUF2924 domain-containing protein n=1 Tax=Bremerella sp. TYQ1 TaxID=3119568 RepID=UPI001CCC9E4C|nr:DUF2924 domain-containing protein [Bremerella volcania]UBM36966.1 DUF2924 domain-containing protein [Bremerella volcania]
MSLNIDQEVATMELMTVNELREKFAAVFGEATNGRNKRWLIRRIAWRLQANEFGGLSQRAKDRAAELVNVADIRVTPPRDSKLEKPTATNTKTKRIMPPTDPRLPPAGTSIIRTYKGKSLEVRVLEDGLEYEGERYKSLSAVAKAITGSHCNGYRFFRLEDHL